MVQLIEIVAAGISDSSGNFLEGASAAFYEAGSNTPISVYQERELENAHANPAALDDIGRLIAFSDTRVKVEIIDASGDVVYSADDIGFEAGDLDGTELADSAVTSKAIADGSISSSQIAASAADTNALADQAVTTSKIADGAILLSKLAPENIVSSPSSGTYASSQGSGTQPYVVVLTAPSITTIGRPVEISLEPDGSSPAFSDAGQKFRVMRDSATEIGRYGWNNPQGRLPGPWLDNAPAAGAHVYTFEVSSPGGSTNLSNVKIVVREVIF